jgi:regulatory protein
MTMETKTKSEYARALDRLTRYLALRDHSRFELQQKLLKSFPPELVERVLSEAAASGWLAPDEEIAARAALALERKCKSRRYIEGSLRRRGLPIPPVSEADGEAEVERARSLAERRFGSLRDLPFEERARVFRFLKYRGFEDRRIRQVLNEK